MFACTSSDFHPYECDGPGVCYWCDTEADLARAKRELATMERAPGEHRVVDEQAWLDACHNKRAWIAKLEAELDE